MYSASIGISLTDVTGPSSGEARGPAGGSSGTRVVAGTGTAAGAHALPKEVEPRSQRGRHSIPVPLGHRLSSADTSGRAGDGRSIGRQTTPNNKIHVMNREAEGRRGWHECVIGRVGGRCAQGATGGPRHGVEGGRGRGSPPGRTDASRAPAPTFPTSGRRH